MSDADLKVERLIRRYYAEKSPDGHLVTCPDVKVIHPYAEDGEYGCDTGCPYFSLSATLVCPHEAEEFEYGDFGQISYMLEDIQDDE